MAHFVRDMGPGQHPEIWFIDDEAAYDALVMHPERGPRYFRAPPGGTPWDTMREQTSWLNDGNPFHQLRLGPFEHNPRIARPMARSQNAQELWSASIHLEAQVVATSRGQARALLHQLERICQTVEPGPATFDAYGHDIRNLLLLACMEVETHWRGILDANGAGKSRYTTTDYAVLADILKLGDYAVRFPAFPSLDPVRPFVGWGPSNAPTASLAWYAAHNAVKHNREVEFSQANLRHAFQAMSACAVMLVAQFGPYGLGYQSDLSRFFHLVETPSWPWEECCFWAGEGDHSPLHQRFKGVSHPDIAALAPASRQAASASSAD